MPAAIVSEEGVIDSDRAYSLKAFQEITGLKAGALREARQRGLLIRRAGVRSFILGRDFLDYLEQHGKVVGATT